MPGQYEMRVGDAEREATVTELREHFASGRLTQEEFNERVDQAFSAKTRGDLKAVMSDLPSARPLVTTPAGGSRSESDSGASSSARGPLGAFAIAMTAVWLLVALVSVMGLGFGLGDRRPFAIVALIFAFGMLRRLIFGRRRARGCGRGRRF
jgi:hypothetical protein